ncbi:MAG: S41 family peptidase [Paludibacteraceae bacterium]|nr:S41 family peptidase [Paludibacteraceae bacterium]
MKTYLHILFIALPLSLCMLISCRPKDAVAYSMDPVTNVEALWQIIDTKYCYVENKGVCWDAIHDEYIARASRMAGDDPVALFDLCAGMLDSLHDGHVNLYSSFDISVNRAWYDTFPTNFDARLQAIYMQDYRIAGGLYYSLLDNGHIGYIYYSSFTNSFSAENINWIFRAFEDCRGLIIDVRNNGGGDLTNAYRLSSPFFTDNQVIGYWCHKVGPGHNDFSEPEPLMSDASMVRNKWHKPVVVLCNRHTYSAANMFVNIMRYVPQATVMGGITGGGGGMPLSYELPCGWMVRFSSVRMTDRDRNDIEEGIMPDVPVTLVSTDKDDIIEAAVTWIDHTK